MQRQDKIIEIVTSVTLALASLVAAWNAYQSAAWSSEQAALSQVVARKRLEATRALTRGGQLQILDVMDYTQWLEAARVQNKPLADYYRARFRAEFKTAFDAWLKLDPAKNTDTPPPFTLSEYQPEQYTEADQAEEEANQAAARFQSANDTSTAYVRNTLFTAMALFFGGIAGRFDYRPVRIGMVMMAILMLLIGIGNAALMPKI